MKTTLLSIIALMLLGIVPAPVIEPNGVQFDPNLAPSPVMGAFKNYYPKQFTGEIDVIEPEGETLTVTGINTTLLSTTDTPDGRKYTYSWVYTPTEAGIKYIGVTVTDSYGNTDQRTIVLDSQVNKPPVIVGCRGVE